MPQVPAAQGPRVALGVMPNARQDVGNVAVPDVRLPTPTISTPQYRTPQLRAGKLDGVRHDPRAISDVRMSSGNAQQLVNMGADLIGVSETLNNAALAMQAKVNATIVDDALDQARQKAMHLTYGAKDEKTGQVVGGYRQLAGEQAIRRESGKGLDDEVVEQFDSFVQELTKGKLTNAVQRQAFEQQVGQVAQQLRQGAAIHQAEQFDAYQSSVYASMVKNQTAAFGLSDYTDLKGQNAALEQIDQAVATQAINNGAPEAAMLVGQRAARSEAVATLFDRAMSEKKYDVATAILNDHAAKIDANTATKMRLSLDGKVQIQVGEQLADDAWNQWAAPTFEVTEPARAFNVVLRTENRGTPRQTKDGKLITSPKGAYGVAQLMPETAVAMAKKLKRPELAELSKQTTPEGEAANRLLGETYFNELVTQFKGDTEKAMAAYNAGPGWLIGGKDSRGNRIEGALNIAARTGTDWRDHLPKETRDYLAYAKPQLANPTAGVPKKPSKSELYAAIDARTADPDARRAAYARVDKRYAAAEEDERTGYEQSYLSALRIATETGGNVNAIDPALRRSVRPDQWTQIESYSKTLRAGEEVKTDPTAYLVATNPEVLKTMTPAEVVGLQTKLSPTDYKRVADMWTDQRSPEAGKTPTSLDVSLVDGILNNRLLSMGINPAPGQGDKPGRERIGAMKSFVHEEVLKYQRATGEKITDYAKMQEFLDRMFTRNQDWKVVGGFNAGPRSTNVMSAEKKDIPKPTADRLSRELEDKLGRKPSDGELLGAYYRSQFY